MRSCLNARNGSPDGSMSTKRKSQGGWVPITRLKKGPNGRSLCRWCSTEVPEGRRSFCSDQCVEQFRLRSDPGFLRLKVFERDHGICQKCGLDTMKDQMRRRARGTGHLWQADHIIPVVQGGGECDLQNIRTLCTRCHKEETRALAAKRAKERHLSRPLPLFDTVEDQQTS